MKAAFGLALAALLATGFNVGAVQARQSQDQQMMKLSPETRLEQRCNAKAMGTVNRDHKNFKTDEFVAYAFADTVIQGELVKAPGGAIRNGNVWYHLAYTCQTSDQGLAVKSFSYQLGEAVPRSDWEKHFLVPK
ncbi:MAG TPA: DUF930 domain-containing protein [Rhodopseudomonas sp.]|uniref:DUF930 domain-containing protein n=1 Tax=Rhodopseudomonas sp. TaxID=1078 RepID=UPI002ED85CA8